MNSGTENIYWGVLLVFAFFMHHCFYSPIFKKKSNNGIDKDHQDAV